MELYEIYWFPKINADCEKHSSMALCSNYREAWQIAKKCMSGVMVVEVVRYADIAGGDKGEEYWADWVMYNGNIISYYEYKSLKDKQKI